MGQMRFTAPTAMLGDAWERAYLAGIEGIPWRSRNRLRDGLLVLSRDVDESANLYIPWVVDGYGPMVLSTASLMEREEPYRLEVELARGTVSRLRNHLADVQAGGLSPPAGTEQRARQALQHFIAAATADAGAVEQQAHDARAAIELAVRVMDESVQDHARQLIAARRQDKQRLPTLLAGDIGIGVVPAPAWDRFTPAFNAAAIPLPWRSIQPSESEFQWDALDAKFWAASQARLRICAGPLISLQGSLLPEWLYLWEDDFDNLQSFICQFVAEVVRRYRGRVHVWHCAARLNLPGALELTEEQNLQLAVAVIQTVRRHDAKAPTVISFAQPWAEYLASEDRDLSPLHFADALVRAGLGIAGIGLDIDWGYWPYGTMPRDLLEFSRQIDRWSLLGLPLLVSLSAPSTHQPDPQAELAKEVAVPHADAQWQRTFVHQTLHLLLAKPAVHALTWHQLADSEPHAFAHGGLFDESWQPKIALEAIADLRQKMLN